jgi:hypothetical protein
MFFEGDDAHRQFSFPLGVALLHWRHRSASGLASDALTAPRGELVAVRDQFAIRMHSARISLLLMLSQSAR